MSSNPETDVRSLPLDALRLPAQRLRASGDLDALRESVSTLGLLQPVVVASDLSVLCGIRRIEVCKALGWSHIPAVVRNGEADLEELATLDENLCRRELDPLERAEHLARRRAVWEKLNAAAPASEAAGKSKKKGKKGDPGLELFLADTEKKTGRARALLAQELKIAELPEDVRELARETPVRHNKKELLALTRMPEMEQREALGRVRAGESKSVRKKNPKAPKAAHEDAPSGEHEAAPGPLAFEEPQAALLVEVPTPTPMPLRERVEEDPLSARWSAVSASLMRGEYELEQALCDWPMDPRTLSEEGDPGREKLRSALEAVRSLLETLRDRAAA